MHYQILTMLELQQELNVEVHADWRNQGFPWYRAIWVECAELLDHYGWKWWKKQTPQKSQVELELVDIWHFGLSDLLQRVDDSQRISQLVQDGFSDIGPAQDFRFALEEFVAKTLQDRAFSVQRFAAVMQAADLSFDALYSQYLAKNVLNSFRQSKGYKEGTYNKIWQGREDNEHLVDAIAQLNIHAADARDQLFSELERRYEAR